MAIERAREPKDKNGRQGGRKSTLEDDGTSL